MGHIPRALDRRHPVAVPDAGYLARAARRDAADDENAGTAIRRLRDRFGHLFE